MIILIPSEKDSLDGLRCFRSFFYPKNVRAVLPIDKRYNCPVFLPKSVTGLYVTFVDIYAYFSKKLPSKSRSLTEEGIPITSAVSRSEY